MIQYVPSVEELNRRGFHIPDGARVESILWASERPLRVFYSIEGRAFTVDYGCPPKAKDEEWPTIIQ